MSTERKNRPDQSMSSGVVQPTSPSLDNEKSEWFGTNTNALSNKQRTDRSGDSHMKHHKHAFNNSQSLSQQDLLGGISNEDILKLTRLTASLPDDTLQQKRVKNDHKKQHSDHHDSKPSRRRHHSSNTQDNSTSITNTDDIKPSDTTRVDSSLHPKKEIIQGKVSSSTPSTSLPYNIPNYNTHYNSDESSSDNEGSRPTVDMNTMSENIPVIHAKTEAESYIEEVNQYNADLNNYRSYLSTHLSNTNPLIEDPPTQKKSKTSIFGETLSHINATMSKLQPRKGTPFHTPSNVSMDTAGRRHSFDNVSTFSDARYGVSGKESSAIEYISGEEYQYNEDYPTMDAVSVNIETADPSSNRVISDPIEEQVKLFRFDYKSLPKEVKSLVDEYDRKGKVKRRVVEVIDREEDMEDDDLLDDDEDEDDEDNQLLDDHAVHYRSVIKGITNDYRERGDEMKELAIVSTTRSDNLEFTKLVQVPTNDDTENGHLLDLHVSLFGVDNTDHTNNKHNEEQFDDLLKSVEVQLQSVLNLKLEYVKCFADYQNSISELDLESDTHDASLLRANSFSTLPSRSPRINDPYGPSGSINSIVSAGIIASPMNDNLINKKTAKKRNFHDKTMKARWLINASKKELREFTQALKRTEDTMNNIQIEMESTKNKVDTNIKDIPESHNLTLKLLEEDIEFILNRRAKNPWLDTGYAILSYVLTFCALVVWIVIYMLKLGKRVLLFPHRLWMTYTEYMAERKKIKEAKHEEDDGYLMSRPLNMGIRVPSVTIESDELRNRRVYT